MTENKLHLYFGLAEINPISDPVSFANYQTLIDSNYKTVSVSACAISKEVKEMRDIVIKLVENSVTETITKDPTGKDITTKTEEQKRAKSMTVASLVAKLNKAIEYQTALTALDNQPAFKDFVEVATLEGEQPRKGKKQHVDSLAWMIQS